MSTVTYHHIYEKVSFTLWSALVSAREDMSFARCCITCGVSRIPHFDFTADLIVIS